MKYTQIAEILHRAEREFNGDITICKDDCTDEFAAICRGYAANGGGVYVATTYGLKVIIFESYSETFRFASYCMARYAD